MKVNIKNLVTGETLYENLEITDIMYGSDKRDDRVIVFLPDGEPALTLSPSDDYLVYDASTPPEPEPGNDTDARLGELEGVVSTLIRGLLDDGE